MARTAIKLTPDAVAELNRRAAGLNFKLASLPRIPNVRETVLEPVNDLRMALLPPPPSAAARRCLLCGGQTGSRFCTACGRPIGGDQ